MRKKIMAFTLVLSLIVSMFLGTAQVFAAGASDFTITALVSDSASEHKFRINNVTDETIEVKWQSSLGGGTHTESISANGSVTVTCADSAMQGLNITAMKDGQTKTVSSLNTYAVSVVYKDQAGKTLKSMTENCTKNGGISHTAPGTLTVGSDKYVISGTSYQEYSYTANKKQIVFTYAKQEKPTYSCPIVYVDQDGNEIGSSSLTVKPDQDAAFTPPSSLTGINGRKYTLQSGQSAISHKYSTGSKEYVFHYQIVKEVSTKPYLIRIVYQDSASGAMLSSQNATVQYGKTTTFKTAEQFVTSDGIQYNRKSGELATIKHNFSDTERIYAIKFVKQEGDLTQPYNITVRYIDAYSGSVIKNNTVKVNLKETARYSVDSSFTANGEKYILASGQPKEISHQFGTAKRVYDVYFNEQGAGVVDQYNVTIRYFDITENKVLNTETAVATLENGLKISVPSSYTADGENYLLLSGQDTSIQQDFYSVRRVYVFFFRNENDTQNANTVVTPGQGGNTVVTTPNNTVTTVTPGGTITVTNPQGETVTIPETEVPLAQNPDADTSGTENTTTIGEEKTPLANQSNEPGNGLLIGLTLGGIVLVLAAGVVVFVILKKKKANQMK